MELTVIDFGYLGFFLEGFFFGLYSGIFAIYLQHHGSQKNNDKAKNFVFYALWLLYALSAVTITLDMVQNFLPFTNVEIQYHYEIIQVTVFTCCDFITQTILIYRCWIMWGYSIRVVIVPLFLAFAFLVIWVASGISPLFLVQDQFYATTHWGDILGQTGITLSMTVNALVTGLIVFRIFKVFQQVKTTTADDHILGVTGGSTLRRIMFILIESGMALFSIQLARLVASIVTTDASLDAFNLVIGVHEMLNGITPTIILVRVSMGLSFHDESSMVEASIRSLCFAPNNLNPIPETGSINSLNEGRRDDDIEIQLTDDSDIQMVDR